MNEFDLERWNKIADSIIEEMSILKNDWYEKHTNINLLKLYHKLINLLLLTISSITKARGISDECNSLIDELEKQLNKNSYQIITIELLNINSRKMQKISAEYKNKLANDINDKILELYIIKLVLLVNKIILEDQIENRKLIETFDKLYPNNWSTDNALKYLDKLAEKIKSFTRH